MIEKSRLTLVLGLVALGVACLAGREMRVRRDKRQLKEQVQTWEDEGGNVPDVPTASPRIEPPTTRP